ncbi:MAG: type II/IV secretion system protein [Deltaproteobacteria bacterium]|nr:type II/IV secretion system protein [Deltaproteobacteria bacterium]
MIKNINFFIAGLFFVAIGAMSRHSEWFANILPYPASDTKFWIILAFIGFALSFLTGKKTVIAAVKHDGHFTPVKPNEINETVDKWSETSEPDIPLIIDFIIYQAIQLNASDIHFDPDTQGMKVRFRIQGLVKTVVVIKKSITSQIINRLKVLSNLVIYNEITPQDGRFDRNNEEEPEQQTGKLELSRSGLSKTDFRIAFMPTLHGERIVIRILGRKNSSNDLDSLGLTELQIESLRRLLSKPQGMIILTGPTGSGKTTTIFAIIAEILKQSNKKRSVATLEDPIEFDVSDINQSQVNEERNFTFEKGLRAILRQDPDVIMVGEIRDAETAKIAIQAGMTGHLLITTVHAGTSAAAFARLQEMGIPAFSMNSAITAVIAQRLIQNICPHCKTPKAFTDKDLEILKTDTPPEGVELFFGMGCEKCDNTGYLGRSAIYEILEVNEPIRKIISNGVDSDLIYNEAKNNGMTPLWNSAINAVEKGITTIDEVERTVINS